MYLCFIMLKSDVLQLQCAQSEKLFTKASEMFIEKWKEEKSFVDYFKKWWLSPKRSGWYQGYSTATPDHNNNNETDNKYIKECQDRKRLGLIQFLNHAESNLIKDWSKRRRSEGSFAPIEFHCTPQLSLKDWTNAWQWSSLNKDMVRYKKDGRDYYCMPSGLEKRLSMRTITKYFNIVDERSWSSFDEYVSQIHTINYVSFVKKDWIKSVCSCVYWAKNYFCHHVIGLAVSRKKQLFWTSTWKSQ